MIYDVIVVGGGTAGCACAYTLGKLGLKTLIIEKNSFLGGTMTSALVTPAMNTVSGDNTNFYKELTKRLSKLGGQATYSDGNPGWFNPELLKIVLDEMMSHAKVDVIFDSEIDDIICEKNHIKNVKLNSDILSVYIETKYVVDSTGDCNFSKKLNCNFLNKNDEFQPNNLRFIMSGINIKQFSDWIMEFDKDRNVTTSAVIDGQIHLSTAYTWDTDKKWALRPFFEDAVKKKILKYKDTSYFQVFTVPGMFGALAFNTPRIVCTPEINPLDPIARSKALQSGRQSILRIANFCKTYLIGFENAYISSIANSLGVRVSRRIKGKYVYTIEDLRSGKEFENPCLTSNYPVDIHSNKKNNSVLEKQKNNYTLPLEALISADYDNLFVIGRCISADFQAQAALRIIPSCFSMGEGIAKYISQLGE